MKRILTTEKNEKVEMYINDEMEKILEIVEKGIENLELTEFSPEEFYFGIVDILKLGVNMNVSDETLRDMNEFAKEFSKIKYEDITEEYKKMDIRSKTYLTMLIISAKELLTKISNIL